MVSALAGLHHYVVGVCVCALVLYCAVRMVHPLALYIDYTVTCTHNCMYAAFMIIVLPMYTHLSVRSNKLSLAAQSKDQRISESDWIK